MVTSGLDHLLNVWDLRTYKQLKSIKLKAGASCLTFSQKNYIAAALRNEITVFNNELVELGGRPTNENEEQLVEIYDDKKVYLKHRITNVSIKNLQFCPYEDVLGIGHGSGVSSILVPGIHFIC